MGYREWLSNDAVPAPARAEIHETLISAIEDPRFD
jgi:hypothetical protein